MKEYKSKKEFKELLNNMDAIEVYQEVLRGKYIKRFPKGFWQKPEAEQNIVKVTKYMIEDILKWDDEDIKNNLSIETFKDNKLLSYVNNKHSLYELMNLVYPDRFKPWELKQVYRGFWNDEDNVIKAVKWLIEDKLKWSDKDIKEKYCRDTYINNGLNTLLNIKTSYELLNLIYPDKFKPWDLKQVYRGFWNDEDNIRKVVKWLIEDKLKWSDEDIKEKYCGDIYINNGLNGLLSIKSLYELINLAYPDKFKLTDFKNYKKFKKI